MAMPELPAPALTASAFLRRLVGGIVLLNLIVVVLGAFWLKQARQQDFETARITAQNLANVLDQYIAGTVANVDLALRDVADEYPRDVNDARALDDLLARHLARQQVLESLRMTDASGVVRYGIGVASATAVNVADRDYFIAARDRDELAVSKPLLARIAKKWVITLARRVHRADGSFGGVVYANVAIGHLTEVFANLDVGPNGSVALRDGDLGMLARYPDIGGTVGSATAAQEFRTLARNGTMSAVVEAVSATDGVRRLYAYRKVAGYPFIVTVGLAHSDFLAAWQHEAVAVAVLIGLFMCVTLAAGYMLANAWRRQTSSTEALLRQELKFHTLADYTYDWEYCQSADRREILYMTPSCERVTGYRAEEFAADPELLLRIVHADDRAVMERHLAQDAESGDQEFDFRIIRRDGGVRWIAHACRPIFEADGRVLGRRVGNRDITERKRIEAAEARLRASLGRLTEIGALHDLPFADQLRGVLAVGAEHFGLGIGIVSRIEGDRYEVIAQVSPPGTLAEGQVFRANLTYCSITLAERRVVAIAHMGVSDYVGHPCYREFDLETYIGAPVEIDGAIFGTINFSSGEPYAREFDQDDREFIELLARWVGSAIERKRAGERIEQLAYYDTLTGLPNRRMMIDRVSRALAQAKRFRRSLAVMFLDLDDFKRVNDALGHEAGDELLKEVALRLAGCVRSGDTVSRQGGDEFVIVLAEIAEPGDAARVADKIAAALHRPFEIAGAALHVTTSVGIAVYPVNGSDEVRELLKKADQAMYAAKAAGRGGYRFHADETKA